MLSALDVDAVPLRDVLRPDTEDRDVLATLKSTDFVWISADRKQTTRTIEAQLLREAKVTALYLARFWSKLDAWDQAVWMVKTWRLIDGFVRGAAKGTVAEISQNGRSHIMNF